MTSVDNRTNFIKTVFVSATATLALGCCLLLLRGKTVSPLQDAIAANDAMNISGLCLKSVPSTWDITETRACTSHLIGSAQLALQEGSYRNAKSIADFLLKSNIVDPTAIATISSIEESSFISLSQQELDLIDLSLKENNKSKEQALHSIILDLEKRATKAPANEKVKAMLASARAVRERHTARVT